MPVAVIESLDHEGRGVCHLDGKAIFVDGALPRERVEFSSYKKKPSYEQAQISRVLKASSQRVSPKCPHFGVCGGCSMQHLDPMAQAAAKQRILEDALWHLARQRPGQVFPPIYGPNWGYRSRARVSVRLVPKKGGVLVGFHEKRSSYIADMAQCEVLPANIGLRLMSYRQLVAGLSRPDRLPQIEVAQGEGETALVLRHLEPLTQADFGLLRQYADEQGVVFWLQSGGPDTVRRYYPEGPEELFYSLPDFGLKLYFRPTDFTQVNVGVNRMLVRRAMRLLDPQQGERIGDMFCGLGNFTLPIARLGADVLGIEGSKPLVERALDNARRNELGQRVSAQVANLFEVTEESLRAFGRFDKLLIDPPREGAIALVKALGDDAPKRIVYVSCSPSTLARDAAVLVHEKGYRLLGAGIANMFPHTSHVESIALFER